MFADRQTDNSSLFCMANEKAGLDTLSKYSFRDQLKIITMSKQLET